MRGIFLSFFVLFILFYCNINNYALTCFTNSGLNEFGGKTIENIYDDKGPEQSQVIKVVFLFNPLNFLQKEIWYYTPQNVKKTGIISRTLNYSNTVVNQYLYNTYLSLEELEMDEGNTFSGKWFNNELNFFRPNGKKFKTIHLFPEWYRLINLVKMECVIYDEYENIKRSYYYNKEGKVINVR